MLSYYKLIDLDIEKILETLKSKLPLEVIEETYRLLHHNERVIAFEDLCYYIQSKSIIPEENVIWLMLEVGKKLNLNSEKWRNFSLRYHNLD